MPELSFQVEGAETASHAPSPTLVFKLGIAEAQARPIEAILLRCQIQIDVARRRYARAEEGKLFDLFGVPQDWGRTLRSMVWTQIHLSVVPFSGSTTVDLAVPCRVDLHAAAQKYFEALESGEIPLRFLFSGTVFYTNEQGNVQIAPIPWDKGTVFRLPLSVWQKSVERYSPDNAWLPFEKEVQEQLDRIAVQRKPVER